MERYWGAVSISSPDTDEYRLYSYGLPEDDDDDRRVEPFVEFGELDDFKLKT